MTQKQMEEINKMMIHVFNDGYEQLIMPRFEELEEKIEQSKKDLRKELTEAFKTGQQSLSDRLEVVERKMDKVERKMDKAGGKMDNLDRKMDQVITENKNYGTRLDIVERIIKAN